MGFFCIRDTPPRHGVLEGMFCGVVKRKNRKIEKFREGEPYEREKQRAERKQEGAAEKSQREEKGEEGKEEMVGCAASVVRGQVYPLGSGRLSNGDYFFLTPATISKIPPAMANTPMTGGRGIVLFFSL